MTRDQGSEIRDQRATQAPCPILFAVAAATYAQDDSKSVAPSSPRSQKRDLGHPRVFAVAGLAALMLIAGCRQDMQDQPKLISQRGSEFFADHRGARPQAANTVARGQLREDSYFYTGVVQGANGYREEQDMMPFPVTL